MSPASWRDVRRILEQALDLAPTERARFLDGACAADSELRSRVDRLLAGEPSAPTLTNPDVRAPLERALEGPHAIAAGASIGSYRVTRVIGAGGMGTVFEAVQEQPRRTVALKVIRPEVSSPATLRRFEREVEVLGRLQHPGIARIYEAGTAVTPFGEHPYFAMELVIGESIKQHADSRALSTRERLGLVSRVCDAVQHAHERGVVHRDLKPGNILVDESGNPKILDFGVARATDANRRTLTLATGVGEILGTIAYMSPEQVQGGPDGVDARCDVYALGVIAYELLTGRLPYDVVGKPVPEAARIVRDEDPTPPSTIDKSLRGDLETILTKALAKDRTERYASAASLGADIERYLADEPIVARPPTTLYQLGKFAQRNRALVGGIVAVFLITVIAAIVAWVLLVEARRQQVIADWNAYIANIAAAESALRSQDVVDARRRLAAAPEELRSLEWHHLERRLDRSIRTIRGIARSNVAWSPTQDLLATISGDNSVRLVDPITGREIADLGRHETYLQGVALSPDGKLLATSSFDDVVKIWDVGARRELSTPASGAIVAWSPDGRYLYAQKMDGTIRRWLVERRDSLQWVDDGVLVSGIAPKGDYRSCGIELSRDGRHILAPHNDELTIMDVESRRTVARLPLEGRKTWPFALHPREPVVVFSVSARSLWKWNWQSGRVAEVDDPAGGVTDLEFNRDGTRLYSAGPGASLRIWDPERLECLSVLLGHEHAVTSIALSPDEKVLASTAEIDADIKFWDVERTDVRTLRGHLGFVFGVAFSPDGRLLASTGGELPEPDSTVRIWDVASGREVRVLRGHDVRFRVRPVAFAPDGRTLVTGAGDRTLRFWDVATGEERECIRLDGEVRAVAYSPDGELLVVSLIPRPGTTLAAGDPFSGTEVVLVFDSATHRMVKRLEGDDGLAGSVAFSPDGGTFAVSSEAGTVHFWDSRTFETTDVLRINCGDIFAAVFSPDGSLLAIACDDSTLRVWDLKKRGEVEVLRGHSASIRDVAFSPDGKRIATASLDRTVRLWDVARRQLVATLHGHTEQLFAVKFSPDGRTIATGSYDRTVRLWESE